MYIVSSKENNSGHFFKLNDISCRSASVDGKFQKEFSNRCVRNVITLAIFVGKTRKEKFCPSKETSVQM